MAESEALPKSLRILCFGDSLTAGFTKNGEEHHPYADHLRAGLQHTRFVSDVKIDVAGFSGDTVVQGLYVRRMKRSCEVAGDNPYDWIIVMGGTNDLAWGEHPDVIYNGLSKASSCLFHILSPLQTSMLALC